MLAEKKLTPPIASLNTGEHGRILSVFRMLFLDTHSNSTSTHPKDAGTCCLACESSRFTQSGQIAMRHAAKAPESVFERPAFTVLKFCDSIFHRSAYTSSSKL